MEALFAYLVIGLLMAMTVTLDEENFDTMIEMIVVSCDDEGVDFRRYPWVITAMLIALFVAIALAWPFMLQMENDDE